MPPMRKKTLAVFLMAALLMPSVDAAVHTIQLPNIGTAALATLSIDQEIEMGDFYLRMLRGNAPISQDPLINQYMNHLGKKLVAHADSVQTPFHFFVMQSRVINAFAFFGGNVVIHSKLILETDSESELASVMSHEIAHVTQRHLARTMEAQKNSSPYVWGGALGSILLALANPTAGMAALTSTIAGSQQKSISFTQNNEREADRIGIGTLTKSGFDPSAFPDFLQKLADNARYSSKPPEMLLTHPLPANRLTDIRNRVNQLPLVSVTSSLEYFLVKMRLVVFNDNDNAYRLLREAYQKLNRPETELALTYGNALKHYRNKNYGVAKGLLLPLLERQPNNVWFIDLMTDIDLEKQQVPIAVARLEQALKKAPQDRILQLNLANAYYAQKNWLKATNLLHRYTHTHPEDSNGWELLAKVYSMQRLRGEEMTTRAELSALDGELEQAITLLTNAKRYLQNKPMAIARNDARIKQLQIIQKRYKNYRR